MTYKYKCKTEELPIILQALQQLGNKKLPAYPVAYRIGKAFAKVNSLMKGAEKKHNELVKKYGKVTEDGKQVSVTEEFKVEFENKSEELTESEVEIEVFPIEINSFSDPIEAVILSPLLDWFIVNTEDPVVPIGKETQSH